MDLDLVYDLSYLAYSWLTWALQCASYNKAV